MKIYATFAKFVKRSRTWRKTDLDYESRLTSMIHREQKCLAAIHKGLSRVGQSAYDQPSPISGNTRVRFQAKWTYGIMRWTYGIYGMDPRDLWDGPTGSMGWTHGIHESRHSKFYQLKIIKKRIKITITLDRIAAKLPVNMVYPWGGGNFFFWCLQSTHMPNSSFHVSRQPAGIG